MIARDCDVCLRRSEKPEFDAWRWHPYWVPLDSVVEFKRDVYQQALSELSRYVFRPPRRSADRARPRRCDEHAGTAPEDVGAGDASM